ncbi:MAG: hypothetical protein IKP60_05340 [Treponema sp.]|nr:hypothetical protein [Treponema sp.]
MGKKTEAQKKQRKKRTMFLYTLVSRTVLFLSLLTLIVFIIYVAGNFQEFLDSTQRYLLRFCSISCVLQGIFCMFGIVLSIVMFIVSLNPKYWLYFFIDIVLLVLAVVAFVVAYAMAFLSAGI